MELVQLIFQTLPVYDSLVLQRAVLTFLRWCCLRNETLLKTMAGALVRLGARKMPKQDAYVLLKWSSEVVSRLQLPEARKAVSKLAECQVRPATCALHLSELVAAKMRQVTMKSAPQAPGSLPSPPLHV